MPNATLPDIPNLPEYVTKGFDTRTGTFATNHVFKISYDQGQTGSYTIDGQTAVYRIPDGINYDTSANGTYMSNSTTVIQTKEDYREYISASVDLGGSYEFVTASGKFSMIYSKHILTDRSKTYSLNVGGAIVFDISRSSTTNLHSAFQDSLAGLVGSGVTSAQFKSFFETYGTHYLESGCFGGAYLMTGSITTSAISTMSRLQLGEQVSAGFSKTEESGNLSIKTLAKSSLGNQSYYSDSVFDFTYQGGTPNSKLDAYIGSIANDPVLLLNPAMHQESKRAVLKPHCDLLDGASAEFKARYRKEVEKYLQYTAGLFGPVRSIQPSQTFKAGSDGLLGVMLSATDNGDRSQATIDSGAGANPTTMRAATSQHFFQGDDVIVRSNSALVPICKGENALLTTKLTFGSPQITGNFTDLDFSDGVSLGTWEQIYSGGASTTKSVSATTAPGFLAVMIVKAAEGDRGTATVTVGGTQVSGCAMHLYQGGGVWVPETSTLVPVGQGQSFTVDYTATFGNPTCTIAWLPLSVTGTAATSFAAPELMDANVQYTAGSDGFVVAYIDASVDGARAEMDGIVINHGRCAAASAHYFIQSGVYVPYNALTMPVSNGQDWLIKFNSHAGLAKPRVYWISATR